MWSTEITLKFIEEFQSQACLWDVTATDYKNKNKKKDAVESLSKKYDVSSSEVEKKITA